MAERNATVPEDTRIIFRIGINVGDIIIDGEDIFGDGVNVAARLQTLAEPGGICVSRVVRDQVLDKLNFAFDDLGAQEMKNIPRPIEVYRVVLGGDFAAGPRQPTLGRQSPAKESMSIAVLPFVNRSHDDEDEYFSDGLADELLNVLAKIRGLRVAARTSSFQFKGKNDDIAVIGRKLNVATVLEGSVRKAGNRMRISVQLVKGGRRLSLVVGDLRPDAGGYLRGAGRHRAIGGEGVAQHAARGDAGLYRRPASGGGGGDRREGSQHGSRSKPAVPAGSILHRSKHPRRY
jgi:adenylate cyclase